MMHKKEIGIIGMILIILIGLWLSRPRRTDLEIHVYRKHTMIAAIDLHQNRTYTFKGAVGLFHLEVKEGRYRAIDVDCPNQICVHTGWVKMGDETPIICAPNGITVVQESKSS